VDQILILLRLGTQRKHKVVRAIGPFLFVAGILFFAVLPRNPGSFFQVSFSGLILAAMIMALTIRKPRDILTVTGLGAIPRDKWYLLIAGLLAGVIMAFFYRSNQGLEIIPVRLASFAFTAAAIGCVEEMLFRGFLQTQLRKLSIFWSVILATASHTAYKVLLFASLAPSHEVNLGFLLFWTFACGLVFGYLKERAASTYSPLAGHAAFDVLVYGDRSSVPWWIWA
jgi:membrane protease YdiL (CAAX protease family)